MTHIDFNASQGFIVNPSLMIPNSNLVDRGKIAQLPPANLTKVDTQGWIWMIPMDRSQIPARLGVGPLPQALTDLSKRLAVTPYEEVTVSYSADTVGGGITFAAVLIPNATMNTPEGVYNGPALMVKRLA